jgi:hypothetical protein
MDKVVWKIIEPVIREHLVQKYVPREPIDPLVIQIVALYWLLQELIGFWKTNQRLTFEQKKKVLHLLIWNFARLEQEQVIPEITEDDITISSETTEQIAQLVLACKEFA